MTNWLNILYVVFCSLFGQKVDKSENGEKEKVISLFHVFRIVLMVLVDGLLVLKN